jgi:predicted metal-binding membrane protein
MVAVRPSVLETVLRRDQAVVIAALLGVIAVSWAWIAFGAGTGISAIAMTRMPRDMVMSPAVWTAGYAALMLAMWWVMMVAMMLPGASPMLLIFARISHREQAGGRPYVPTGIFAAGYLSAWAGFSAMAVGVQWSLERAGLMSAMMVTTSRWLSAGILIAAGLWQLTPIKHTCLRQCRSPVAYLSGHWRDGRGGAFSMGLEHGAYCLGCCWFLMALLFVGGVMNLYWIAGIAAYVLLEKLLPLGHWLGYAAGVTLTGAGLYLLATG